MKKVILTILLLSQIAFAQVSASRYEAEMMKNPNKGGKDTREVNAVMIFEKDSLIIKSRRKNETFKEFKYSDIKYVEHSFSKNLLMSDDTRQIILAMLFSNSILLMKKEKHWLTILTEKDFVVLKIENDNYRLLKMEFIVRKLDLININENKL